MKTVQATGLENLIDPSPDPERVMKEANLNIANAHVRDLFPQIKVVRVEMKRLVSMIERDQDLFQLMKNPAKAVDHLWVEVARPACHHQEMLQTNQKDRLGQNQVKKEVTVYTYHHQNLMPRNQGIRGPLGQNHLKKRLVMQPQRCLMMAKIGKNAPGPDPLNPKITNSTFPPPDLMISNQCKGGQGPDPQKTDITIKIRNLPKVMES